MCKCRAWAGLWRPPVTPSKMCAPGIVRGHCSAFPVGTTVGGVPGRTLCSPAGGELSGLNKGPGPGRSVGCCVLAWPEEEAGAASLCA